MLLYCLQFNNCIVIIRMRGNEGILVSFSCEEEKNNSQRIRVTLLSPRAAQSFKQNTVLAARDTQTNFRRRDHLFISFGKQREKTNITILYYWPVTLSLVFQRHRHHRLRHERDPPFFPSSVTEFFACNSCVERKEDHSIKWFTCSWWRALPLSQVLTRDRWSSKSVPRRVSVFIHVLLERLENYLLLDPSSSICVQHQPSFKTWKHPFWDTVEATFQFMIFWLHSIQDLDLEQLSLSKIVLQGM